MNVTKIIQEELGQMLEKAGFQSDFKKIYGLTSVKRMESDRRLRF